MTIRRKVIPLRSSTRGLSMKKALAAVIVAMSLWPSGVFAQERAAGAALGAVSGAIVLGPVGAVAGAVVGYAAGPSVARAWGSNGSAQRPVQRSPRRDTPAASRQGAQRAGTQGASSQSAG